MGTIAANQTTLLDRPEGLELDDLRDLMQTVTRTTEELRSTHVALRSQVDRLQGELAEANARLKRSEALAALGEVAAGIAHEVRNPLASIQLYTQMLAEDVTGCPEQLGLCDKISRAVIGLDAIVRDVLLFAKDMSLDPHPISADEVITRALAACEGPIVESAIDVEVSVPRGLRVLADPTLLNSAVTNVLRNAVEASAGAGGGRVRVSASRARVRRPDGRPARSVVFAIEDDGPGIPADVVERMFNPFFTTRATGTGLGLAIVHRIIDAHDGHIDVKSHTGGGTTIVLCLPETSGPTDGSDSPLATTGEDHGR